MSATSPDNLMTFAEAVAAIQKTLNDDRTYYDISESNRAALSQVIDLIKGDPCLMGLQAAEPWFVFRGQDNTAHIVVDDWADLHQDRLGANHLKIVHAREVAEWMRLWWPQKLPD